MAAPLRALAAISPIRWAIDALCISELRGMNFERGSIGEAPKIGALAMVTTGDQVLSKLGLENRTYRQAMMNLARILAAEVSVAILGLAFQRPNFLRPTAATATARDTSAGAG